MSRGGSRQKWGNPARTGVGVDSNRDIDRDSDRDIDGEEGSERAEDKEGS